MSIIKV